MKYIIANWKMKLSHRESIDLAKEIQSLEREKQAISQDREVVICPSYTSMVQVKEVLDTIKLGAQNVYWENVSSCTGEVSPRLLFEVGCEYVIIGHSSRRRELGEKDELVNKKIQASIEVGLIPIVCVGETLEERNSGKKDLRVIEQVLRGFGGIEISKEHIIIAYEPVWAISPSRPVEVDEAEYMHNLIRHTLADLFDQNTIESNFSIIYGGSINATNAARFLERDLIDGVLVGAASLDANEFIKIINSF